MVYAAEVPSVGEVMPGSGWVAETSGRELAGLPAPGEADIGLWVEVTVAGPAVVNGSSLADRRPTADGCGDGHESDE